MAKLIIMKPGSLKLEITKAFHPEDFTGAQAQISLDYQSTFFQSTEFFELASSSNHLLPSWYLAKNDGVILGCLLCVVQFFGKTRRFYNSRLLIIGGPLIFDQQNDCFIAEQLLKRAVAENSNNCAWIEVRNRFSTEKLQAAFQKNRFKFSEHLNFFIDLDEYRAITLDYFQPNRRQQIKKSLNGGARINENPGNEKFFEFYQNLKTQYREKVKKPLPPMHFFKQLYEKRNRFIRFICVEYHEKIIGGVILLLHEKRVVHEWYLFGLPDEYSHLYPSVMASWAAIEFAAKNGFAAYDFMGAGKPGHKYGVREFKKQFGGKMVNYGRYVRINYPVICFFGKKLLPFLSKLVNKG